MRSSRGKPVSLAAFWLSYDGARFHGYQAQAGVPTVQAEVLRAFAAAELPRNPVVGGRTDKGVSARMQVLSARLHVGTSLDEVKQRLNAVLPDDVRVELVKAAPVGFHAAWSASGKVYRYEVPRDAVGSLEVLREVAALVPGTRNFKVFHFKTSEERPRSVHSIDVQPRDDGGVTLEFRGDGFARYMVRMLTGALLAVARGEVSVDVLRAGLERQENFFCPVAPAEALTLWEILYPAELDPFTAEERRDVQPRSGQRSVAINS